MYLRQHPRLGMFEGVLYKKFFDHTGSTFTKQYCLPKQLRKEVLYRIHNSPWGVVFKELSGVSEAMSTSIS